MGSFLKPKDVLQIQAPYVSLLILVSGIITLNSELSHFSQMKLL